MGKGEPSARNNSSSLRRALQIITVLADEENTRGYSLTHLANRLQLNKSTLNRLLAPLQESMLVRRDEETGRYQLGPETARLGGIYLARLDLRSIAADVLGDLVQASQETAHLVVPNPPDVVYVDKVESPNTVRMFSRIGSRQAMYCTAVGKACLAHMPDALMTVLNNPMPSHTPNTITDPEALRRELAKVREVGYAVDDIENEMDIRCVGAAILDQQNDVAAAVSISGPAARISSDRVPELGRIVREAARALSARLGAPGTDPDPTHPRQVGETR